MSLSRRARLLQELEVQHVFDVGANVGDYGVEIRNEGFRGTIHSFEPLAVPFEDLRGRAAGDPLWHCHQVALGESKGLTTINVSGNVVSSSILEIASTTVQHASATDYVDSQEVPITTLDSFTGALPQAPAWLKLDVQGYELHVLRGASATLTDVVGIDCEVSLVPLYRNQPLIEDIFLWLRSRGYTPSWVEPGVIHQRTGALLQLDVTFERL